EPHLSEGQATDGCSTAQANDRARGTTEERLGPNQPPEVLGIRTARPQQRLLASTAVAARCCDHTDQQGSDDHAGQSEEEEEQLRVDRVRPGTVELGGKVVADQAAARERDFEVLRTTDDLRERRTGILWQLV